MKAAERQKLLELKKPELLARARQEWESLPKRLPDERQRPLRPNTRHTKPELVRIIDQCHSFKKERRKKKMTTDPRSTRPTLALLQSQLTALGTTVSQIDTRLTEASNKIASFPADYGLTIARLDPHLKPLRDELAQVVGEVVVIRDGLTDLSDRLLPRGKRWWNNIQLDRIVVGTIVVAAILVTGYFAISRGFRSQAAPAQVAPAADTTFTPFKAPAPFEATPLPVQTEQQ